jgi:hypothetical protein
MTQPGSRVQADLTTLHEGAAAPAAAARNGAVPMEADEAGAPSPEDGATPEGAGTPAGGATPSESEAEPDAGGGELRHKAPGGSRAEAPGAAGAAAGGPSEGAAPAPAARAPAAASADDFEIGRRGQQAYKAFVQSTGLGQLGQARAEPRPPSG